MSSTPITLDEYNLFLSQNRWTFCGISYLYRFSIFFSFLITDIAASWEEWWTYDGISGNNFSFENGKTRSLMQLFWLCWLKSNKKWDCDFRHHLTFHNKVFPCRKNNNSVLLHHNDIHCHFSKPLWYTFFQIIFYMYFFKK